MSVLSDAVAADKERMAEGERLRRDQRDVEAMLETERANNLDAHEIAWVRAMMAVDRVADATPGDARKLASRARLFENVDRQIRARVAQTMPGVLVAAQKQIEAQLGANTLTESIRRTREHVAKDIRRLTEGAAALVDDAIDRLVEGEEHRIIATLEKRVRSVVAAECAKQLRRVMNPPAPKAAKAPPKKRKSP